RDRGRSGDDRRGALDARAPGRRLSSRRHAARGCDRHRSRTDGDRDPARDRRRRQVRRVLRRRTRRAFGRGPRDARQHVARLRRARGDVPRERPDDRAGAGGEPVHEQAAVAVANPPTARSVRTSLDGEEFELGHGAVVIAAITSCTNTSNPQVMVGAGLLAKKAVEAGLTRRPWVKSSLAPGSRAVTAYYEAAGLDRYLDALGVNMVGYRCTTCIG